MGIEDKTGLLLLTWARRQAWLGSRPATTGTARAQKTCISRRTHGQLVAGTVYRYRFGLDQNSGGDEAVARLEGESEATEHPKVAECTLWSI